VATTVHDFMERPAAQGFVYLLNSCNVPDHRCVNRCACPAGGAILQQIDLVVPRGSLAVVLGNSGSGKTTLLRGIMQVGLFLRSSTTNSFACLCSGQ